ncbi:MAG TPA: class I SAM-dependent methyltransferase [Acidimicrobiales bacterium]
MVEQSRWAEMIAGDPGHSQRYAERFRELSAAGKDIDGEARLVDAMAPRHARILDAGCGPGRVGGALARVGHEVVGVDADPVLIAAAEADHPGPTWLLADLAELDLPARGIAEGFDVIVSAGNVMPYLAPGTRAEVLRRLGLHLRDRGRIVVGFGAGRDYPFGQFHTDVAEAGLVVDLELATWELHPFRDDADFLVAVLTKA